MTHRCSLGSSAASVVVLLLAVSSAFSATTGKITIDVAHSGIKIRPVLYGLMTGEINHFYDGGLYAECIQNRAFLDDPKVPVHWSVVQDGGGTGAIALDSTKPLNAALPVSLQLTVSHAAPGQRVGIANDGYWGIAVKPHTTYHVAFYSKALPGFSGQMATGST